MSVGVLKTKIAALNNANSNYTVKSEQDVYVLNTSDESIELLTTADSIGGTITLTGSQSISTDSGATATIGSNTLSNSINILSRTVNIGDNTGNRNIHIGNQNETNSSSIYIGSTLADVSIGQPDPVNGVFGSTTLQNKNIRIGSSQNTLAPSSSGSNVYIEADTLSVTSKSTHTSRAVGDLKLVGSNDTLGDTGARSELLLGTTYKQSSYSVDGSDTVTVSTSPTALDTLLTTTDSTTAKTLYSSTVYRAGADRNNLTHTYHWAEQSIYAAGSAKNNSNNSELSITNPKAAGIDLIGDPYYSNTPSIYLRSSPYHNIELHAGSAQLNNSTSTSIDGSKLVLWDYKAQLQANTPGSDTALPGVIRGLVEVGINDITLELKDFTNTVLATGGYAYSNNNSYRFTSSTGFDADGGGYSPFTGVHIFDIMPNETIQVGDAVELVNKQARVSSTATSKICVGIAVSIHDNKVEVAAVGDTECGELKGFKVCDENGSITAGDLLVTSSRPGYLMKQTDDIQRSTTVGKSAVDVEFNQDGLAVDIYGFVYCG